MVMGIRNLGVFVNNLIRLMKVIWGDFCGYWKKEYFFFFEIVSIIILSFYRLFLKLRRKYLF